MKQTQAEPVRLPRAGTQAPQSLDLRHLRYLVAVAEAGTFTRAAEQLFIAQPTLSQQIGRLEQIVGTPLLHRRREGVQLTPAGAVLLKAARDALAAVDHAVSCSRQAAGLGRPRLRIVLPADLPDSLAVQTASRLRSAADSAQVAITWMDTPLDAEFSPIREHRADAGLGWLTASPDTLRAPLDAMTLGEFEPEAWIPRSHPAARHGVIGLDELAGLEVIHGPRRAEPGTYDAWTSIVQTMDPQFAFTDPPLRHSLPVALAFAATAARPAAVLTGPAAIAGTPPGVIRLHRPAGAGDMARVSIAGRPLTATAALVWNGDLPRPLQQILFDTADGLASTGIPVPCWLITSPQRECCPVRPGRVVTAPTSQGRPAMPFAPHDLSFSGARAARFSHRHRSAPVNPAPAGATACFRPEDRARVMLVSRQFAGPACRCGARIGHKVWAASASRQVTGLALRWPKIVRSNLYL